MSTATTAPAPPASAEPTLAHPTEVLLRADRLPHIWCPGCGIGIAVTSFVEAHQRAGMDPDRLAVVSGIGCSGRVAGYINADSFHTTHGRAIPFAIGLHIANPELNVVVFSGDGDLASIGGNHLIHAARRNVDLTVICINNFNYGMTGGQAGPTTHTNARTTTTPRGNADYAFNLPKLAVAAGATYVARWTVAGMQRLRKAMQEALTHRGFAFLEVISPCTTNYGRRNRLGSAMEEIRMYKDRMEVRRDGSLENTDLVADGPIPVGTFMHEERPTFADHVGAAANGH